MKIFSTLFLSALVLLSFTHASAQQIAFPGAEGAGRFATGGKGTATQPTTVFEVTRIDDPNPTVAGTLRYALAQSVNTYPYRTIAFRVSGTIRLTSRLNIPRNTTIAGQTAPGDGICLADRPVVINGDNVIIRYIRIRMGDRYQNNGPNGTGGTDDTFGDLGHKHIMVDHCSISWSSDEACATYRGDSVTLQYNLISEPLNANYHWESPDGYQEHGYVGIWGARHASFHHNLLAHAKGRMPRFAGNSTYQAPDTLERADFRNNVVYHWLSYSTNGGEGGNYNLVNNYYKRGPNTSTGSTSGVPNRVMTMNPSRSATLPYPKLFVSGNFVDETNAVNANTVNTNNWRGIAFASGSLNDSVNSKVTSPFDLSPFPATQTAQEAYQLVLDNAGATLPRRDTLDARVVNDVRNRTGRVIDKQGGFPRDTPFEATLSAWPTLVSLPAPLDTDHDGMPDDWETANGSDPNNAADRSIVETNGYTRLENYLNGIVNAALPLHLLEFNGTLLQKAVSLKWNTAGEVNTYRFIIERSADGSAFYTIGHVAAANTGGANHTYAFSDPAPLEDKSFYRLKMMDKDGRHTYSPVLAFIKTRAGQLSIHPNLVTRQLVVAHPEAGSGAQLQVYSTAGQLELAFKVAAGTRQSGYDVQALSPGMYTLVFTSNNQRLSQRFVKQ